MEIVVVASGRLGKKLVSKTTEAGAGDTLELVSWDDNNITVADITQHYVPEQNNLELLHHAAHLKHIRANDSASR